MPPDRAVARDRNTKIQRVLLGLLVANLAVVVAKFVIGARTGSLGVLGDAVHSSVDAMNNVLGVTVMWFAAREPDEDHPYGHEKFETLGALAIVVFLSITGFELMKGAISRLGTGSGPLQFSALEFAVLLGTLVVNTVVTVYETRRGRELNSDILLADSAHTRADVFITIGVLVGVLATQAGFWWVDSIVALLVAGVIVILAYSIVVRSLPVLVDQPVAPAAEIQRVAESVDGVVTAYHIRSRGASDRRFAELTIAGKGDATVESSHHLADVVEMRLRKQLEFQEVVVHIEPC